LRPQSILYICHRVPYPPNKGDKIRAFHELRAMARHHHVDLFALADDPTDLVHEAPLRPYCRSVEVVPLAARLARLRALPYLLGPTPLTVPYFHSAKLQTAIRQAATERKYDCVFVYCSAMAQYVEGVVDIPVLTDLVDVDSAKWTQYAACTNFPLTLVYSREGRLLRDYERRICEKSAAVLVSTEREAQLVHEIQPRANVQVVPNGVDTEYFNPTAKRCEPRAKSIIFTGDMAYFPNQQATSYFAKRVLPAIRRSVPDARFFVVGRNPSREVLKLQEIAGVTVTGFVEDVRTYLAQAQIFVAPFIISAGIQNKILEAMAFGLPVVATTRVLQGLSPAAATVVEIGDTPEELAAKVIGLLTEPDRAARKGIEGRRLVSDEYNWDRSAARLLDLLEDPKGFGSPKQEIGRLMN
jgi:sugar transferase (PEP-CTERM/EpsH1 system associated)